MFDGFNESESGLHVDPLRKDLSALNPTRRAPAFTFRENVKHLGGEHSTACCVGGLQANYTGCFTGCILGDKARFNRAGNFGGAK